ncbi:type VII secretion protein EccB [Streptomyces sp. STR69]|uniref:type VII secretion protein EccB n=1 Tax=Streptomyces sp. STR69 TaxID=1796942 RepID=UPI0021C6B006|nr:type VII secretion protein EccB [Streptomyces sp. STR69]
MQSRRDQVQAHMFVMGRLTSGMLRADPDAPESPQGRTNRGVVIGLLVAVLVSAGAFVFGIIKPGGTDTWRTSGNLIVDTDTGSRYLYLDGRLRPVRNYASARLLLGADLAVTKVHTAALSGTQHGSPVGIDGAPDALPTGAGLNSGPWQVCSGPDTGGGTGSGSSAGAAVTTLAVGASTGTGTPLASGQGLPVVGPDGTDYLLWQGSRLRLDRAAGAIDALGYGSTTPRPVSAAFLDALPSGPDLTPPDVPGRGDTGPALGGLATRVGQVFQVSVPGGGPQYYLLLKAGLTPLTATGAALVLGDPQTGAKAYAGGSAAMVSLGADALKGHLAPTTGSVATPGLPESPPSAQRVADGWTACARVQPSGSGTRVSVDLVPADSGGRATQALAPGEASAACLPVNSVTVRAGGGALVRALGEHGDEVGDTTYLVTDTGVKYQLGTETDQKALGYADNEVVGLPFMLLSMLPTGPELTGAAASSAGDAALAPAGCGRPDSRRSTSEAGSDVMSN